MCAPSPFLRPWLAPEILRALVSPEPRCRNSPEQTEPGRQRWLPLELTSLCFASLLLRRSTLSEQSALRHVGKLSHLVQLPIRQTSLVFLPADFGTVHH